MCVLRVCVSVASVFLCCCFLYCFPEAITAVAVAIADCLQLPLSLAHAHSLLGLGMQQIVKLLTFCLNIILSKSTRSHTHTRAQTPTRPIVCENFQYYR